jgi:hypothetical protein
MQRARLFMVAEMSSSSLPIVFSIAVGPDEAKSKKDNKMSKGNRYQKNDLSV